MTLNCLRRWGPIRSTKWSPKTTPSLLCHLSSTSTYLSLDPDIISTLQITQKHWTIHHQFQPNITKNSRQTASLQSPIQIQHLQIHHQHLQMDWTIHHQFQPNITKNSPPSNSFKLIQFRHLSNVNSALLKPGSLHHQNTYKLHKNTGLYITNFNQISPKTLHLQTASN